MDPNMFDKEQNGQRTYNGYNEYDASNLYDSNTIIISLLAYFSILFILGLVIRPQKDMEFVKTHVNNGIWLTILSAAATMVTTVIGYIPLLGKLIGPVLGFAFGTVILLIFVVGIISVVKCRMFEIPFLGKIKLVK